MKHLTSLVLWLLLVLLAGCMSPPETPSPSVAPSPTPRPTPSIHIEKTTIGLGRTLEGPLTIHGRCVRVQGMALAWTSAVNAYVDENVFRFQNRQGEVLILHPGDSVLVDGSCIILDPEWGAGCATPTLDEAQATSTCDSGPYFIAHRIRKVHPTSQPPPSP